MAHQPSILEVLRAEIEDSDLNLKQIAARANPTTPNATYQHLQRWHSGVSPLLNAPVAESVYYVLTGKSFTNK